MQKDVIIIGAGIAGLSAALELKKHKFSYLILEASDVIGGRAGGTHTKTGLAVDLGAHWFHGENNPLKALLDDYKISYRRDKANNMVVYKGGRGRKVEPDWLENMINEKKAKPIAKGLKADCEVPDLAKDKNAKENLEKFVTMWDGLDPPHKPSAREYLNDKSVPGGLQLPQGIGVLLNKMAKDVGLKNILFKKKVSEITTIENGIRVKASGKIYEGKIAVFTGSLGVIKSNVTKFKPGLSADFRHYLSQVSMGKMNKIIVELEKEFFELKNVDDDLSLELLDGNWPHFCHIKSAGNPLITLFISGPRAKKVESFNKRQALEYLFKVLKPVKEIKGFEKYIIGKPLITNWFGNPYIRGSYSACLPGAERQWPPCEGNVYFAGDTFDKEYPGAMAGAYRSGKVAALMIKERLTNPSPAGKRPD